MEYQSGYRAVSLPQWNKQRIPIGGSSQRRLIQWAVRRAKATAGQFNLTLEICRDLPIPLAPEPEQTRIVSETSRLFSVDDEAEGSIELNLRRCERLRQAILKWAFE